MQTLRFKNGTLKSTIQIPPSKSYANRALILAAIAPEDVTLTNMPEASDVTILIDCLRKIGLEISVDPSSVCVRKSFPECGQKAEEIYVGEGGTTARFLACLLLLGRETYRLRLGKRLKERPWGDFLSLAAGLGAFAELEDDILTVRGPARFPSALVVDCSKTTQFATGLQLLSPKTGLRVDPLYLRSSKSYWEMTKQMLDDFRSRSTYRIPSDWSSASYPLAFAALNQEISFPGLYVDDLQADAKFLSVLRDFNCVQENDKGISIRPLSNHMSVRMDVSDCLDLVPTLGYFLAHITGEHELSGVENLVHKESDRLSEVITLLNLFEREAKVVDGVLCIKGDPKRLKHSKELTFPDDHRMVMTGALFLRHHAGGSISPAHAVLKSWPSFFSIMDL